MVSLAGVRNANVWPRVSRWPGLRSSLFTVLHNANGQSVSLFLATALSVPGFFILLASQGIYIPSLHPSAAANAVQAPVAKPRPVSSSRATAKCATGQGQSNSLYTTCPSFAVDYGNQTTAGITSDFNVYTGIPEANNEAELYTNSAQNLRVQSGNLLLEAQNTPEQGFNYTSARINTQGKEDFLYGKLVIRATLPDGIGTWPAIWMLPSDPKYASLSPVSDVNRYMNDGEIDIAEAVGTQPHMVYGIAHSLAYPEDGVNRSYFNTTIVPDNNMTAHDYEVDWTPTSLTFLVDGTPFFTYAKQPGADYHSWPFDQPFYLILNLALGGSWGGTDTAQFPGDGVDKSALPAIMSVQSIHYYSYVGTN